MRQERVSIKDIAREAGVSHPTVSRALSGSPSISSETRARIQQLAREMGYTPNAIAQSLQTSRTNTVGLVVTSIADPFFVDVVKGVEEVARPAGISVFLSSSYNDPEQEVHIVETFHRRRVDGLLVASSRIGTRHLERLVQTDVPVVLVSSQAEEAHPFLYDVTVDDRAGARQAVEYLLSLGHRKVGYIGIDNRPRSNARRRGGYREAMEAAGITPQEAWMVEAHVDEHARSGDVEAARVPFLQLREVGVTAVLCYNDMVALGVLLACRAEGVRVPADCSIVGFDDIELARYLTPPLTTMHQPKREMGRIGMEMLIQLLQGEPVEVRVLEATLVCRGSTAPPGENGRW